MYGEYYVTKFFTDVDDIRLHISSLLIYIYNFATDGSHNRKKKWKE